MIKVGTVCSGIGAPEKALHNLGIEYELAYFCEFDKFAAESYCAIHGVTPDKNLGDLTKVDISKLPHDLDLLVGGTPCQDFSIAGLRKGGDVDSGTRSSLMWNFVQIIRETQPKAVLWENVPGCISGEMKLNYDKFFNALLDAGYNVHSQILNAKHFGVPQSRDRVFVLAIRKDIAVKFAMPSGYDCGIKLKDVLEENVDEKYFLSAAQIKSLMAQSAKNGNKGMGFKFRPISSLGMAKAVTTKTGEVVDSNWIKEELRCIELTQGQLQGNRVYSVDGVSVTLSTNGGGLGATTGLYLVPHGGNKGGFKDAEFCPSITTSAFQENCFVIDLYNGIIRDDCMAGTLTTGTANNGSGTFGVLVEIGRDGVRRYYRIRKLTPKECFRLMGFADTDFKACKDAGISNSQLYKQAGNSIVVNVTMALFGELYGVEWRRKVYGDRYQTEQERMAGMPLLNWQVG